MRKELKKKQRDWLYEILNHKLWLYSIGWTDYEVRKFQSILELGMYSEDDKEILNDTLVEWKRNPPLTLK
jgi:hypothetical protein